MAIRIDPKEVALCAVRGKVDSDLCSSKRPRISR
jgi:hypothetical protein